MSGTGALTREVTASGDARIDGILNETAWGAPHLTFSFPAGGLGADGVDEFFRYGAGEDAGMFAASAMIQAAVRGAMNVGGAAAGLSVQGFTGLTITETTDPFATIRVAQTTSDPYGFGTAWAYLPGTGAAAGDVWFCDRLADYAAPRPGSYAHTVVLHELGHALGLEHGHSGHGLGVLPAGYDAMEYSVMTYRSYIGASGHGYVNAPDGFAQSWMMLDIAALQHLYGADYTANAGDTLYQWRPGSGATVVNGAVTIAPVSDVIFATIWDGGGVDTFDLSAYRNGVQVDLAPGAASLFSADQAAGLGNGHLAKGNIYNALLHEDDPRALIEDAIGGRGDDTLAGNRADNALTGGLGHDRLEGRAGDDLLRGQAGQDHLSGGDGDDDLIGGQGRDVLEGGAGRDRLTGGQGRDVLTGGAGGDWLTGKGGADVFRFAAGDSGMAGAETDRITDFEPGRDLLDLSGLVPSPLGWGAAGLKPGHYLATAQILADRVRLLADLDGDGVADFRVELLGLSALSVDDILL